MFVSSRVLGCASQLVSAARPWLFNARFQGSSPLTTWPWYTLVIINLLPEMQILFGGALNEVMSVPMVCWAGAIHECAWKMGCPKKFIAHHYHQCHYCVKLDQNTKCHGYTHKKSNTPLPLSKSTSSTSRHCPTLYPKTEAVKEKLCDATGSDQYMDLASQCLGLWQKAGEFRHDFLQESGMAMETPIFHAFCFYPWILFGEKYYGDEAKVPKWWFDW